MRKWASRNFRSLPRKLRVALREFHEWSQKELLIDQTRTTPKKSLYHYTNEESFRGILSTERLWCFDHKDQRDHSEFEYSLAIAREIALNLSRTSDEITREFCSCLASFLKDDAITANLEFFLFSLSRHRNDARQWFTYGQKGTGFSIGFAPTLFEPNEDKIKDEANENHFVGSVIYGNAATELRHRKVITHAAKITSRVARANSLLVHKVKSVYLNTLALEVIASPLIWNCLTAKKDCYHNEEEVRYIIMDMHTRFNGLRKDHSGKSYMELKLDLKAPGSITEVWVGPHAPLRAEQMIREFLKTERYPESIPIHRSAVVL